MDCGEYSDGVALEPPTKTRTYFLRSRQKEITLGVLNDISFQLASRSNGNYSENDDISICRGKYRIGNVLVRMVYLIPEVPETDLPTNYLAVADIPDTVEERNRLSDIVCSLDMVMMNHPPLNFDRKG